MVNNFDIIKPLLQWDSDDQFYFIQVLQRKKDAGPGIKVNGTNNNSRLIKAYYVASMDYLEFVTPEIIQLCEIFGARAGINLNRRSFKQLRREMQKKLIVLEENKMENLIYKAYPSVAGKFVSDNEKKWIIDIDKEDIPMLDAIKGLLIAIEPYDFPDKVIAQVPSKSGYHLITRPFNKKKFKDEFPSIDIQPNNPTNLFIP